MQAVALRFEHVLLTGMVALTCVTNLAKLKRGKNRCFTQLWRLHPCRHSLILEDTAVEELLEDQ